VQTLIFYEDLETALRAKRWAGSMEDPAKSGNSETNLWSLELLRDPFLRQQAAVEAAASRLVILSLHGAGLPDEVRQWMRLVGEHHPLPLLALAVVLDPERASEGSANPVAAQVQRAARELGASFVGTFSSPAAGT
jgi:hypothetical protein